MDPPTWIYSESVHETDFISSWKQVLTRILCLISSQFFFAVTQSIDWGIETSLFSHNRISVLTERRGYLALLLFMKRRATLSIPQREGWRRTNGGERHWESKANKYEIVQNRMGTAKSFQENWNQSRPLLLQWSRLNFSQLHVARRILMNLFIIVVLSPINRRHPCAPVGSHHQQCRATDALNAVFECICRSCSIKISGWQINLTIERSPLNIARINSRRSGAVVDHHLGPEIWWVTWLAMDWEGGEMKGKRLMWWLLADCCKAAKWELSQKHRVDDLINSRSSN